MSCCCTSGHIGRDLRCIPRLESPHRRGIKLRGQGMRKAASPTQTSYITAPTRAVLGAVSVRPRATTLFILKSPLFTSLIEDTAPPIQHPRTPNNGVVSCPTQCLGLGSYPQAHEPMKGMAPGMLHPIFTKSTHVGEACQMRLRPASARLSAMLPRPLDMDQSSTG